MVAKRSKNKSTKTPLMTRIIGSFDLEIPDPTVIDKQNYKLGKVAIANG